MLRSIKQLYGSQLAALDGEIGQVKDLYFDDVSWMVRYLAAETGTWLTSRQVLLSPHALGNVRQFEKNLQVNLSRQQIEQSPAIEWHKPVSRQFEAEYHRYYGWPCYWEGNSLSAGNLPVKKKPAATRQATPADVCLRSAKTVKGCRLQAGDGITGYVADFLMDTRSWTIQKLVIKTGLQFSPGEIELPISAIERICWDTSTVFTRLTRSQVERSPAHVLILNGAIAPAQPVLRA